MPNKIPFLNIKIDNVTFEEALDQIEDLINDGSYHYVVTPNIDHLVRLEEDNYFREVYQHADLILLDSQPLKWISNLKGTPIKEKISGSDLFPKVCDMAAKKGYKVYLLGAAEGVAETAARNLETKYPGLNVVGTYSPSYGFENNIEEINHIISEINLKKPDILAVGLGAPKQEKFIYRYKDKLKVSISLAIGASIDFEAGNINRAPRWMQKSGLEWFYRFTVEPRRLFKRYFIDDVKIFKILIKF